jgi:hypothetical protein
MGDGGDARKAASRLLEDRSVAVAGGSPAKRK